MLRSSDSEYSSVGDKISSVPKGTATVAVQYREDTAGTSGETNFSGVHKEAVQPRLRCSSLDEPISIVARNSRAAEPSRASSRDSRARKIKKISYAVQSARTDRRIEKGNVLRNCTDCPMYYGATRATRFAILIPELPRVRLCAMSG